MSKEKPFSKEEKGKVRETGGNILQEKYLVHIFERLGTYAQSYF